jgi:hypothetical protein
MTEINRRQFAAAAMALTGAALAADTSAAAAPPPAAKLPTVRWGRYELSRLLVGHNPIKGQSHFSKELNDEMRAWFADDHRHGKELLRRCEQCGINTCQMGAPAVESLLRAYYAEGGKMQWIVTFYSKPGEGKPELQRILTMDPKPIGAQHYGGTTDRLMRAGKIDEARDTLKMLRDAGLLVGLCSHNHEVIDYAEDKGWDVDFYQCSFYHSTDGLRPSRPGEVFEESAREAMVKTIAQVSKPCIAFKVLGASRHCQTPADLERALRFSLGKIKPNDVVLLGMWQKHKDQVAENAALARQALNVA